MEHSVENSTEHVKAGSFTGHIVPGSMFLLISLWYSVHAFHHYYKTLKHSETYRASHSRNVCFCSGKSSKTQLEAIIRMVLALSGVIGELITVYDTELERNTNQMMHTEHITMYISFGLSAAVDLMSFHKISCLPEGADYFCGLAAFLIEGILFIYHLHGRSVLNTHMHRILVIVIMACSVSTLLEFTHRESFIWSLPRIIFLWLQGSWFWQIGFSLFNPISIQKIRDENDPELVMKITFYFAAHTILAVLVQFVIGGIAYMCHGRPSASEYSKLVSEPTTASNTSSSTAYSDHENWELEGCEEATKLFAA